MLTASKAKSRLILSHPELADIYFCATSFWPVTSFQASDKAPVYVDIEVKANSDYLELKRLHMPADNQLWANVSPVKTAQADAALNELYQFELEHPSIKLAWQDKLFLPSELELLGGTKSTSIPVVCDEHKLKINFGLNDENQSTIQAKFIFQGYSKDKPEHCLLVRQDLGKDVAKKELGFAYRVHIKEFLFFGLVPKLGSKLVLDLCLQRMPTSSNSKYFLWQIESFATLKQLKLDAFYRQKIARVSEVWQPSVRSKQFLADEAQSYYQDGAVTYLDMDKHFYLVLPISASLLNQSGYFYLDPARELTVDIEIKQKHNPHRLSLVCLDLVPASQSSVRKKELVVYLESVEQKDNGKREYQFAIDDESKDLVSLNMPVVYSETPAEAQKSNFQLSQIPHLDTYKFVVAVSPFASRYYVSKFIQLKVK